uniref:Mitochondrial import receptor subunit TOM70 n=2 Tax=Dendroctonus ponderosae TaxID=77166 RepID=A0AAR5QAB5_DENPD
MSSSGISSLKWQIALGLGAVGAVGLACWYMKTSKNESLDSVEDVKKVTEESPFQRAQKFKTEGNDMFKRGKYDEAIAAYTKAIEIIPPEFKTDLATYYHNRAAAYEQLKKWRTVIADCEQAINLNNKYEKALYRRAKAYEMVKDYESALDDVTAVCILQNFENSNALCMADRVLRELGVKHAAEAFKHQKPLIPAKHYINTYFASFSEDVAFKKLVEPTEPLGQGELKGFLKAKLAFATEKYEEIIPACTEELNLSESESNFKLEALALRGSFYFITGEDAKGIEDFTSIIENESADVNLKVNALLKRAAVAMNNSESDDYMADYEKAVALAPSNPDVYHHRGQVMLKLNQTEKARQDFQKAVELNPKFLIAVIQKYYTDYKYALELKDVDLLMKVLQQFRESFVKFPNQAEPYTLFAAVQAERGEYQEAEELYRKALKLDESNASIYVHLGLLMIMWKNDLEGGAKLMRQAINIDSTCGYAFETLATVEVQRGNLISAIELFNRAIEISRSKAATVHLFSLRDAAASQLKVASRLGISLSNMIFR